MSSARRLPSHSPCLYDSQIINQIVCSAVAVPRRSVLHVISPHLRLGLEMGLAWRDYLARPVFLSRIVDTILVTADDLASAR
jgi:hypothetical protein